MDSSTSSIEGSEDQSREQRVEEKNEKLFDEIRDLCKRSDRTKPEVVFLLGIRGVGKSATLNTIHAVLTETYFQIAQIGAGRGECVTSDLEWYKNCGVSLETIKDEARRKKMKKIVKMLPTIIDCAGFENANTPEIQEILELLIGGYIPPETNIETLKEKQKQHIVGCLKNVYYKEAKPEWRVTKVVFVHSCEEAIPKKLIECLFNVLKIVNPDSHKRKYTPGVFLLITKYDLVRDPSNDLSLSVCKRVVQDEDSDTMTLEVFEEIESELATAFNMEGALTINSLRWVSFTDKTGTKGCPYFTNMVFHFLKRMLEPHAQGEDAQEQGSRPYISYELRWFSFQTRIRRFLYSLCYTCNQ